ncbi:hypothetical protein V2J09_020417 [Rumex salicifolius]
MVKKRKTQRNQSINQSEMGCSFSGLNTLYDAVNGGGDVWIHNNRFKILRQLGEVPSAHAYLVKELIPTDASSSLADKLKNPSLISDAGTYAMKKVFIQNDEQLELVKEEIRVTSLFTHRNLLPILDHSIIPVKQSQTQTWKHEAYLLFPARGEGLLVDIAKSMKAKKEAFSVSAVLHIFRQICEGLKQMHSFEPPYAHNDVNPSKILMKNTKGEPPLVVLMDFKSARPARQQIRTRAQVLELQEWACEHCSDAYRAPELWDCPTHAHIDERTDIWSLGCTLYAIMYGISPFEYMVRESGGSLQLAVKWLDNSNYPEALNHFVIWMLQPQATIRPYIDDIIIHVDKLIAKY